MASDNFPMFTKLLRYRLARTINLDINILDPTKALDLKNHEELFGQFVGYFSLNCAEQPIFVLLGRCESPGPLTHGFIFYLNSKERSVPARDLQKFKIPKNLPVTMINIVSGAKYCGLSVFLQVLETLVHPRVFNYQTLTRIVRVQEGCTPVLRAGFVDLETCEDNNDPITNQVWSFLSSIQCRVYDINMANPPTNIPGDFDILRIVHDNHQIFAMRYKLYGSMMILLPHRQQFSSVATYEWILTTIKRLSRVDNFNHIGITRYYGSSSCKGSDVARVVLLAYLCPQVIIKPCDLDAIIQEDMIRKATKTLSATDSSQVLSQASQCDSDVDVVTIQDLYDSSSPTSDLRFDHSGDELELISVGPSSQATEIMTIAEIESEIDSVRRQIEIRQDLASVVPPIPRLNPLDLRGDLIINSHEFYHESLSTNIKIWHAFTTAKLLDTVDLSRQDEQVSIDYPEYRFIVIPIFKPLSPDGDEFNALIIVDRQAEDWVFMSPDNAAKDYEVFDDVEIRARRLCRSLEDYHGWSIRLTSPFHYEYPRVHLLMATYYLARYFRYAVWLPQKIIYAEREFREFCHRSCLYLRCLNMDYNLRNRLIKSNGYFKDAAYVSHFSPLDYHRSVVPIDQCPFCCKRYIHKLAQHIGMAHGGRSSHANYIKNIKNIRI